MFILWVKTMGTRGKINAIWWNIKINLQTLVDICEYELPTNLQNFTQPKWKYSKKIQSGYYFLKHAVQWDLTNEVFSTLPLRQGPYNATIWDAKGNGCVRKLDRIDVDTSRAVHFKTVYKFPHITYTCAYILSPKLIRNWQDLSQ